MKVYNQSLDFTVLALAHAANGEMEKAGRLLIKASKAPDVQRAVAVLEASNAQAFEIHQAQVKAAQVKAAAKPKVAAGKRVAAATQVKAFDIGDEAEVDELINDGDDIVEEEVEAAEEGEEDVDFDAEFASVLAGMNSGMKGGKSAKR